MSDDQMRPPPLPKEAGTEPGLGLLALKAENLRLRRERNEAREALATNDSGSSPPPTAKQRRGRTALGLGKWAGVLVLVPVVARAVARRWPEYTDLVDGLLEALGL